MNDFTQIKTDYSDYINVQRPPPCSYARPAFNHALTSNVCPSKDPLPYFDVVNATQRRSLTLTPILWP